MRGYINTATGLPGWVLQLVEHNANQPHVVARRERDRARQRGHSAKHRAKYGDARVQRQRHMPPWADMGAIRAVYDEAARRRACGEDAVVDHIVPLNGSGVSGLHVHWNLRIVTKAENSRKGNRLVGDVGFQGERSGQSR